MSEDVKRRRYRSRRRAEQAEQTHERVLAAASDLFVERGYDGASIAAIAERAGVSSETIYARFSNKRSLLGQLVQNAVRGADPRPVTEQDSARALIAEPDQRLQLRAFAEDVTQRLERAAPLAAIVSSAARAEPELAELRDAISTRRRENLGALISGVSANGALRIPREAALDTVWALTSPELHQLMRVGRGWSPERYRDWLSDALVALLVLPEGHS
ncbi:MAG: helix-turn-helix domain-containing protein [Thermoleophilia bacterium]